jgi:O6-methylguanine-DNA--protein-cysteine methyltransferase
MNVENTNRHDRQRKLMNAVVTRRHTTLSTTLGDLLAVAEDLDGQDALIGLYFPAHWHPPADGTIGHHVPPTGDRLFTTLAGELAAYLSGSLTTFTTPVRTHGDTFSEQVWDRLTRIPYGATTTYGVIAAEFGNRNLAQRVGQSVGHNPGEHPGALPSGRRVGRLPHGVCRWARSQANPPGAGVATGRRRRPSVLTTCVLTARGDRRGVRSRCSRPPTGSRCWGWGSAMSCRRSTGSTSWSVKN